MKTPIVRAWKLALGSKVFDELSRQFGHDAPTVADIVIASGEITAETRGCKPVLPQGCVFAVRYSSR